MPGLPSSRSSRSGGSGGMRQARGIRRSLEPGPTQTFARSVYNGGFVSTSTTDQNRLRRTLGLRDLILYGIVAIQPVAPMSVFGVLSNRGRGHVVTTILIAMVAMLFTAFSYGRMAQIGRAHV